MKTKKLLFTSLFIAMLTICSFGQSDENWNKNTYFSLYGGYGYINPSEINELLVLAFDNAGIEFESGNAKINFAYIFGTSLNYFVTKNLEVKGNIEFAWAHKQVKILMYSDYFNDLIRLSGGLSSNFHYFLKNDNSVYLGGGLNYNSLKLSAFKDDISGKSTPIGYSFQIGSIANTFTRKLKKSKVFGELQVNLVKGENKEYSESDFYQGISELSFTGIALKFGYIF